jgi:hypothetical protein
MSRYRQNLSRIRAFRPAPDLRRAPLWPGANNHCRCQGTFDDRLGQSQPRRKLTMISPKISPPGRPQIRQAWKLGDAF